MVLSSRQVEPASLQAVLERLSHALTECEAGRPPAFAHPLALGQAFEATGLKRLLKAIGDGALREAAHLDAPLVNATSAPMIAVLSRKIPDALLRRVRDRLADTRRHALLELLASDPPDFLGVMGKQDNENAHSDVLRWLLDPNRAPTIAPHALRDLIGHAGEDSVTGRDMWNDRLEDALASSSLSVTREVRLGVEQDDRIDLLIRGPGWAVAIENKIWTHEHDDQTETYARWLDAQSVVWLGMLLSPSGEPAVSRLFVPIEYVSLMSALLASYAAGAHPNGVERAVLAGYVKALAASVLRDELRLLNSGGLHVSF